MFDFASRITKLDAVNLDEAFLSFIKKEVTELLNTFVVRLFVKPYKSKISKCFTYKCFCAFRGAINYRNVLQK